GGQSFVATRSRERLGSIEYRQTRSSRNRERGAFLADCLAWLVNSPSIVFPRLPRRPERPCAGGASRPATRDRIRSSAGGGTAASYAGFGLSFSRLPSLAFPY